MKAKEMITILAVAAMILAAPLAALGAPPEDPGPPDGRGPGTGGQPGAGDAAGLLYGDLYVIERDGNGVPVTKEVTYEDPETGDPVKVVCNQPLADNCSMLPLWGEQDGFDPEVYDPCAVWTPDGSTVFTELLQTVAFGRESVGRSPASVLDSSYAEALKAMNEATEMSKDPAGRIMLELPVEDTPGTYFWKTIDSPLENLGMYRAVMIDNCLSPILEQLVGEGGEVSDNTVELTETAEALLNGVGLGHLVCGAAWVKDDYISAAVFIGAAADKTSPVTLDEIINMNTYLGINTYVPSPKGKNRTLEVTYLNFGSFYYVKGSDACVVGTEWTLLTATSATTFEIPATNVSVFGPSPHGVDLRGAYGVGITVCRDGEPLFGVDETEITFCDGFETYPGELETECGGANWFAQAAEDARKTIWYLHNWRVPEVAY